MESLKTMNQDPIDLYECFKAFVREDDLGDEECWCVCVCVFVSPCSIWCALLSTYIHLLLSCCHKHILYVGHHFLDSSNSPLYIHTYTCTYQVLQAV